MKIRTCVLLMVTELLLLIGVVGFHRVSVEAQQGIRGPVSGDFWIPSAFRLIIGDYGAGPGASTDVFLQKTAANVATVSNGIFALTYAGGTVTTNGTAVAAGTCQAQPALTVTGVTTGTAVFWSVPTALPATWQTGIAVSPVVTANTVTLNLCNGTAGSITPAAQAVNVRVFN